MSSVLPGSPTDPLAPDPNVADVKKHLKEILAPNTETWRGKVVKYAPDWAKSMVVDDILKNIKKPSDTTDAAKWNTYKAYCAAVENAFIETTNKTQEPTKIERMVSEHQKVTTMAQGHLLGEIRGLRTKVEAQGNPEKLATSAENGAQIEELQEGLPNLEDIKITESAKVSAKTLDKATINKEIKNILDPDTKTMLGLVIKHLPDWGKAKLINNILEKADESGATEQACRAVADIVMACAEKKDEGSQKTLNILRSHPKIGLMTEIGLGQIKNELIAEIGATGAAQEEEAGELDTRHVQATLVPTKSIPKIVDPLTDEDKMNLGQLKEYAGNLKQYAEDIKSKLGTLTKTTEKQSEIRKTLDAILNRLDRELNYTTFMESPNYAYSSPNAKADIKNFIFVLKDVRQELVEIYNQD